MRSEIIARYVIENGQLVDVEIRQERPPEPAAGVFWPRARGINKAIGLLRHVLRIERLRTVAVEVPRV